MKALMRLGTGGLVATLLAVLVASTALGYPGQVAGVVTVTIPTGSIRCNTPTAVSATVLDENGKPLEGMLVAWSFKKGTSQPGDKIDPLSSTTNAKGIATTTVTLACVAGNREVNANPGAATGGAVLGVTAPGLPNTSTLPPSGAPFWALMLAALAVGAGLMLGIRQASPRR